MTIFQVVNGYEKTLLFVRRNDWLSPNRRLKEKELLPPIFDKTKRKNDTIFHGALLFQQVKILLYYNIELFIFLL